MIRNVMSLILLKEFLKNEKKNKQTNKQTKQKQKQQKTPPKNVKSNGMLKINESYIVGL